MLPAIEMATGEQPAWSVIWLHGLGADGNDFVPIVPELVRPDWPALRFVFPHAPVRAVTINRGMEMRAWYDILSTDFARREDAAGVADSVAQVNALIAREQDQHGIAPSRVLLAGFSQGAAIALASGLTHPVGLAGIVALSGYLPVAGNTLGRMSEAGRATPLFMAHGTADPVVPHGLGAASRDALASAGVAVSWHDYPMPHSVCAEEIADLRQWLGGLLDRG